CRVERGSVPAQLPTDAGEEAAGVDRAPAHRYSVDRVVLVVGYARIPARGETRHRIERGKVVARLTADDGEVAAGVDRALADRQSVDAVICARIPCCEVAVGVQLSEVGARLTADRSEASTDVPATTAVRHDG